MLSVMAALTESDRSMYNYYLHGEPMCYPGEAQIILNGNLCKVSDD